MRSCSSLGLFALLSGCGAGADTGQCAGEILLTWNSHGQAIITEYCQPCHASGSTQRNGAPEEVTFDDYEETIAWRSRILATATGDSPTMPPNMGMTPVDQENLWIWLTCGE